MRTATFALAVLAAASAALPAAAHWASADDVVRLVDSEANRRIFDVREVRRDGALPRLLLIRVGPGWSKAPAEQRIASSEEWQQHWKDAVRGGIIAVLDTATDAPLVNFDAAGRARLQTATPRQSSPLAAPAPAAP